MGWEDIADELYALPPEDFVAARDRAAKSAPRGDAAKIRALRRPTLAAWAVNLLVRSDRDRITALLALGDQLRRAHRELDGRQLRDLAHQQRRLVAALSQQAKQLTIEAGRPAAESALREVEATVQAALADPDAADELATGRMAKTLTPPAGFGPPQSATVHPLRPSKASSRRPAPPRSGADREGPGRRPARVTDLAEHNRERARAERERRERLDLARQEAEELERASQDSEQEATAAQHVLTDAERQRRLAEEQVEELTEGLRQAKEALSAARKAERVARGPALRARQTSDRDRERAEKAAARVEEMQNERPPRGGRRSERR
ncbi:hypothetical protein ABZW18_01840 [Streptomyces sp. NPDC004647]|uniref:hypothetical protein n=1 Tax=Streptomyces sp. NPDC004647 TaxID=3154671 RepID=UPI0033A3343F